MSIENMEWTGYFPGVIGKITELHAVYYHRHWRFDQTFETQVGCEVSEFVSNFKESRDRLWAVRTDGSFAGCCAVDGHLAETEGARLRWFIVSPAFQGRGIGSTLLENAVAFSRNAGYPRLFLWTFVGLTSARKLYESVGFSLCGEHPVVQWGQEIVEQQFEILL